jgi:hypothetical protein
LQQEQSNKNGTLIFAGMVLIFLIICFFGYMITGDKRIEERFSNALGLPGESQNDDNAILGFNIEGSQFSYGIIFTLILVTTALIYIKYRI